ncbi:glycosyltransferase (activator-dependent family) [Kibdelosporangium banguiense]|uniref:Glycosyltransferase (Activator-dependent family) n=1 Tax=Kibdelosporangium banguiense TaxID=1365924 RepID=A0ABS4TXE4_9PSEU|nr:activator-dependent family glycosyltransferase [Kibdelosporangium banguiense]MBP2329072.1 glycosyltransferase (activator-dependent family) [Kibdelosporangium banguiense]
MRVLFAVNPAPSIFMYLVPLAWALRTAGHEVRVASQPCLTDEIVGTGLTAVPVGRNGIGTAAAHSSTARSMEEASTEEDLLETDRAGVPEPYDAFDHPDKATWDYLKPGMTGAVRGWHWMDCAPMIGGLVEFARHWQPDLIIWDPLTFSGPIAAKACGAAHARMLFGPDVIGVTRGHFLRLLAEQPEGRQTDPFADWFSGYGRKYGFEFTEDMVTGNFTVDQFPQSLQTKPGELDHVRMQYVPYSRAASIPKWLHTPPQRPRVAMTLGLSATEHFNGYNEPVADIITELSTLDIELVATVAKSQQHLLPTIPDNVRVVPFVPWHALVPTCSAVIHHAGAATLATTSRHPIPQLALHYHFDQPFLARKLAEHGAGLEIHSTKATGDNVRESVQRLLTEPRFTERATALRDEILALPTPNQLVPQLEALATKHRIR